VSTERQQNATLRPASSTLNFYLTLRGYSYDICSANDTDLRNFESQTGVASAGPAVVDSIGGTAYLAQMGEQMIGQMLSQANLGVAGSGGSDNAHSDTHIAL
jgi:hypothetical protein